MTDKTTVQPDNNLKQLVIGGLNMPKTYVLHFHQFLEMDNFSINLLDRKSSSCWTLSYSQKYISLYKIQNAIKFLWIFSPVAKYFDFVDFEAIALLFVDSNSVQAFPKHFSTTALKNELVLELDFVPDTAGAYSKIYFCRSMLARNVCDDFEMLVTDFKSSIPYWQYDCVTHNLCDILICDNVSHSYLYSH